MLFTLLFIYLTEINLVKANSLTDMSFINLFSFSFTYYRGLKWKFYLPEKKGDSKPTNMKAATNTFSE